LTPSNLNLKCRRLDLNKLRVKLNQRIQELESILQRGSTVHQLLALRIRILNLIIRLALLFVLLLGSLLLSPLLFLLLLSLSLLHSLLLLRRAEFLKVFRKRAHTQTCMAKVRLVSEKRVNLAGVEGSAAEENVVAKSVFPAKHS